MATLDDQDLKNIKLLIEVTLDEKLDSKLDEKLSFFPTKDEYYEREDKTMNELKKIRENTEVLSQHSSDHSNDLEKLKKIHPNYKHSFT